MKTEKGILDLCNSGEAGLDDWLELQRLITEYQSPETQRLIELGKAVEKAMQTKNVDFDLNDDDGNYLGSFDSEMLLAWYREQEENG